MFGRLSLLQKIGLYVSALLVFTTTGALLWSFSTERQAAQEQLEVLASALADEIGYSFEVLVKEGAAFSLQRVVEQTATIPGVKAIGVTDRQGEFVFHNTLDTVGTRFEHPLFAEVLASERRQVESKDGEILVLQPLRGERYVREHRSDVVGAVAIWMNSEPLRQRLRDKLWKLVLITVSLALISLVGLLLLLERLLLAPIRVLAEATGRLARDSSYEELPVRSKDELGELAGSFNTMTLALRDREASLELHRNNLEKLVAERTAKLEAKNRELEEVTYTVSHDLKSPLVTIRGFLGLVGHDLERGDVEGARDDMRRISTAASRMTELLGNLLEVFQAGSAGSRRERVSMHSVATDAVSTLSVQIRQRGAAVEISSELPTVRGHPSDLARVLQNLIDNALKFMGEQPHPRIEIGLQQRGATAVFYVRDNGSGIARQYHRKVFGLFKKLDRGSDGSGIGLAIVKRIVEAHGGQVWVESDGDGAGCSFCFTLPDGGADSQPRRNGQRA